MNKNELIYLACPYTHEDPKISHLRYVVSVHVAGHLFKQGLMVFAASMHNAFIGTMTGLGDKFSTWQPFNHTMIEHVDKLMVLTMEGWEQSQGVQDQIEYAKKLNKPVEMIEPPHDLIQILWKQICDAYQHAPTTK